MGVRGVHDLTHPTATPPETPGSAPRLRALRNSSIASGGPTLSRQEPRQAAYLPDKEGTAIMASNDPVVRALVARTAAHARWAQVSDPNAATAPGRTAFLDRFEKQVDPDGTLPVDERARRAEHARKAYFSRLALRSKQARRKAAQLATEAAAADAELDAATDSYGGDDAAA